MAHRAKVMPGRTFRFNECVCAPYNADFDGALTWALVFYFPRIQMVICPYNGISPNQSYDLGMGLRPSILLQEGSGFLGVPWCIGRFCGGHHRIRICIWTMDNYGISEFDMLNCCILHEHILTLCDVFMIALSMGFLQWNEIIDQWLFLVPLNRW